MFSCMVAVVPNGVGSRAILEIVIVGNEALASPSG